MDYHIFNFLHLVNIFKKYICYPYFCYWITTIQIHHMVKKGSIKGVFFFFSVKVVENQKRGGVDSSLFHSYSSRDYLELQLASLVTSSSGQDRGRSDPLAQSQYS